MRKVSQKTFDGVKQMYRMVELDFKVSLDDRVKIYGAEIGNDVLMVTLYNDDISSAATVVPNHELIECDGKYMVAPRDASIKIPEPVMEEKLTKDLSKDEFEQEIDNFPRNTKSIEDVRMAAIEASDKDDTIQLRGLPEDGDGEEVPNDVASYIDSLVNGNMDATPPPAKPKPKPMPNLVPRHQPKPEIQKGKQKDEKPKTSQGTSAFGGW